MARGGQKWLGVPKVARVGYGWLGVARSGQGWLEMVRVGQGDKQLRRHLPSRIREFPCITYIVKTRYIFKGDSVFNSERPVTLFKNGNCSVFQRVCLFVSSQEINIAVKFIKLSRTQVHIVGEGHQQQARVQAGGRVLLVARVWQWGGALVTRVQPVGGGSMGKTAQV